MGCPVLAPEDFVLPLLTSTALKERYIQHSFSDYVRSHPELRFCPGPNCNMIIRAKDNKSKRIVCHSCKSSFWLVALLILSDLASNRNLMMGEFTSTHTDLLLDSPAFDVAATTTLRPTAKLFVSGSPSVQMTAKLQTTSALILR